MQQKRQTAKHDLLAPIGNTTKSNPDPMPICSVLRISTGSRTTGKHAYMHAKVQMVKEPGKHPHSLLMLPHGSTYHYLSPRGGTASFPRTSFYRGGNIMNVEQQGLCAGSDGCCQDVYISGSPNCNAPHVRAPNFPEHGESAGFKNRCPRNYSSSSGPPAPILFNA